MAEEAQKLIEQVEREQKAERKEGRRALLNLVAKAEKVKEIKEAKAKKEALKRAGKRAAAIKKFMQHRIKKMPIKVPMAGLTEKRMKVRLQNLTERKDILQMHPTRQWGYHSSKNILEWK